MRIFRYKADILPIALIGGYFFVDLFVYFTVDSLPLLLGYFLIGIIPKGYICAWNHHHQHVNTFFSPFLNRLLEVVYSFQTGIVGYAWVLHHNLGHHVNYQDQERDESAWRSPRTGKTYGPLMYTWMVASTAYYRAWRVGKKYKKIQRYFLIMCMISLALLYILTIYRPLASLFVFVLPMITGLFLTAYATYDHHRDLESTDPLESSYNIVTYWYNLFSGNLGYHTAHHMKGSLHWSLLPEYHKEIESKIDPKYYKKYHLL